MFMFISMHMNKKMKIKKYWGEKRLCGLLLERVVLVVLCVLLLLGCVELQRVKYFTISYSIARCRSHRHVSTTTNVRTR